MSSNSHRARLMRDGGGGRLRVNYILALRTTQRERARRDFFIIHLQTHRAIGAGDYHKLYRRTQDSEVRSQNKTGFSLSF